MNQIKLPDGSLLQKYESFKPKSYESDFYINYIRDSEVNQRLNFVNKEIDWLSMRPKGCLFNQKENGEVSIGQHSDNDQLQGKGILISAQGCISIGYWSSGCKHLGNNIYIETNFRQ